MTYQPFLIAPFGTGLDSDQESWLLPVDAFAEIKNGHIKHGYVEKRKGFRFLTNMTHGIEIISAIGAPAAVFTVASGSGLYNDQEVTLQYLAGGSWSNVNGQTYTISNLAGAAFELLDSTLTPISDAALGVYTANSGRVSPAVYLSETTKITTATTADPAVFTPVTIGSIEDGDSIVLKNMAGGTWSTLDDEKYTVTGATGTTFSLLDKNEVLVDGSGLGAYTGGTGDAEKVEPLRIMGIFRYITAGNARESLISDTQRVGLYNPTTELIEPLDLVNPTTTIVYPDNNHFDSSNTDYIWAANWQHSGSVNRVYFTNGKEFSGGTPGTDGILYYDASTPGAIVNPNVVQFQPQVSTSAPPIDLYGCKLIFSIRQRLLCLYTYENDGASTSSHPQRARWCAGQNPSNWNQVVAGGGGYVDAPTGEQIISARQIQDVLIVHFTNSVWTLRPVSDPSLPFRWDKINDFRACDAKMATIGYDRYAVGVGIRGITATDGVETRRIDERIQDFVSEDINEEQFSKLFIERSYSEQRTWFLYPAIESEDNNAALIYDDESSAYSKYEVDMNVLGHAGVSQDFAAQDFIAANDLDVSAEDLNDETALSYYWSKNAEILLGGNLLGKIFIMETLNTDDGKSINLALTSAGWNPFKDQGVEAQFGYIDFYFEADKETRLKVSFFKNDYDTAYADQGLDMLPNLNYRSDISDIRVNEDPTTGFTVTSDSHGLTDNEQIYFYGVNGSTFYNDVKWAVGAAITENTFNVDTDITSKGSAITGISNADPAVVTAVAHGFNDGDQIYIVNVTTMTQVNNLTFTVANSTTSTFELQGIDSTAYGVYGGGGYAFKKYLSSGQIVERRFYRTKVWKRAYAGGIGYEHRIQLVVENNNEPLKIHAFKPWFKPRGRVLG